jgi:hypothetical protein
LCGETLKGRETSREDVGDETELSLAGARRNRRRLEAWRTLKEGASPREDAVSTRKSWRKPDFAKTL